MFRIQPRSTMSFLLFSLLFITTKLATAKLLINATTQETNSSLQYHLCGEGSKELTSYTTFQLSGGVHTLQEGPFCLLQNLSNITIQGQQTPPRSVIYCQSETETRRGIAFFNISSLHLSYLDIINCGSEVPSGLPGHINDTFAYLGPLQKAVLIVTHSTNVTVESLSIDRCFGIGMLFINPLGKTVIGEVSVTGTNSQGLSECRIQHLERRDMLCSGSGTVFTFTDTDITDTLVNTMGNYTSYLLLTGCSFFNNTNSIPVSTLLQQSRRVNVGLTTHILLTGGFSIALYIGQKNFHVDVKITDTKVVSNTGNVANLLFVHYNTLGMAATYLERVVVSNNKLLGKLGTSPGLFVFGLFLDSLSTSMQQHREGIFDFAEISQCNFSHNSGETMGSIILYVNPQNISDVRLVVRDTTFTDNVANFGPALSIFQSQSLIESSRSYVYLEDVVASGNTFPGASILQNSPENAGAIFVSHISDITLVGTEGKGCRFQNNSVSALTALATKVVLRGHISFENNSGFRGGALNLIDSSILFVHNNSAIHFTNNSAFREGGAIFINTLGSSTTTTCVIQFLAKKRIQIQDQTLQDLNISMVFSNNSAKIAGNSVFGNPLYYCYLTHISSIEHILDDATQAVLFNKVFTIQDTVRNNLSEVNSAEEHICICLNTTFSSEDCIVRYRFNRTLIPGDTFYLFLNPVDITTNPVTSFLYSFPLSANPSASVELDLNQAIQQLPGLSHCSLVKFTIFAPENTTLSILLFASLGKQSSTIELNTAFCPPGFVLGSPDNTGRLSCLCSEFIETRMESACNFNDYTVARPNNYWVGTNTREDGGGQIIQFVSTCPVDYCREDVTSIDLRVPDQLCAEGRTGTLCGACKEGLSSVFGTAECRKCSDVWLTSLSLFALVGALLVALSLLLDLTITHGLINGAFFYSYIVTVNSNIFLQRNKSGFLFWFLSWTNLDSGFPMCFYHGMTESAKLGLQYVFPSYFILLIAVIIALSKHSILLQRILSQFDCLHMLVTMLYISFLKLFRTVIDTFTFVSIVSEGKMEEDVVWFFDGTQKASNPISIFLIALGSITMVGFILPYVLFFNFSTYIQQFVNSTRLNAFVDASLAPYKNKLRFWFGARLILTSIIYIIIANRGTNNPTFTLTLELSLLVGFAVIQASIRPFKSTRVALLDMSFLLNLIALNLGTLYNIQNKSSFSNQKTSANISMSIAFITTIGITFLHLLCKLRKNEKIKTNTDLLWATASKFLKALIKLRSKKDIVNIMTKTKKNVEGGGEVVVQSGHNVNETATGEPPTTIISLQDMEAAPDNGEQSSFQLREPVLDFH